MSSQPPPFDVLTSNAVDIQQLLNQGKTTSHQIVCAYFGQIDRHEAKLNALISPAPRDKVLKAAKALDEERARGSVRSPLHGIPIVLKDCFITASDLGMSTTCGSLAFVGSKSSENSAIAQRFIDAGLLILGKANMTEFCGMKMTMMMPGWSAHGGQTLSPYVPVIEKDEKILGHSAPGGSSTGSAVAVSAGFSPLAMGTETIGSIITPATRNSLYALKPTVGAIDATGLYTMTDFYDSAGPMAKCAADVRLITSILLGRDFSSDKMGSWDDLSVGYVDPKLWTMAEMMCTQHEGTAEQMVDEYHAARENIIKHRGSVKYPIELPDISVLPDTIHLAHWEFKQITIPRFIQFFDECPVSSVADIVQFNQDNKDKAMPSPYTEQNDLEKAMNSDEPKEEMDKTRSNLRSKAREIVDQVFDDNGLDVLVGPADGAFCVYAAAAGYPVATVPTGRLHYNGRPFGACVMARADNEEALLRFQAAYEAISAPRTPPTL